MLPSTSQKKIGKKKSSQKKKIAKKKNHPKKNRKKTEEERRDLSLSPCFIFYHPPLVFVSSSGLFAANTRLKYTVIIYTTTPKNASSQRGRRSRSEEQRREGERERERELFLNSNEMWVGRELLSLDFNRMWLASSLDSNRMWLERESERERERSLSIVI